MIHMGRDFPICASITLSHCEAMEDLNKLQSFCWQYRM